MTQLSPLPSPGQLPPEDFPYPRLRGAATRSPPQGVPHPGLPWACPGPRCRKRPCSLKAGPAQSRAHHHRPDPPGSVQKDNGASWGAGQKGPSRQTLLESHSPERPPLHISVCFCRHRSRRTPRLPRASPTPLQPLGFPVHPAPTRVPSLTESGRTRFNGEQLGALRDVFERTRYPHWFLIRTLASTIHLDASVIKVGT